MKIAPFDEAPDEAWANRVVAEGPPDLPDEHLDVVGVDVNLGPDRGEQVLLGDQVAGPLDEDGEDVEGLVRQRDPDVIPPKRSAWDVEPERCEILHVGQAIVTESRPVVTSRAIAVMRSYRNPTETTG